MVFGEKLLNLLKNNSNNPIATKLLELHNCSEQFINDVDYLELAVESPNKIGFISKDRIERFKVEIPKILKSCTKISLNVSKLPKWFIDEIKKIDDYIDIKELTFTLNVISESRINYYIIVNNTCLFITPDQIKNFNKLLKEQFEEDTVVFKYDAFNPILRKKYAYMTSPGKMIVKLGLNNNFNAKDIHAFGGLFNEDFILLANEGLYFKLLEGEDIQWAYLGENYYKPAGTLGDSCMRHPNKNCFMHIYSKNSNIKLLTLFKENKVTGRALVWNNVRNISNNSTITLMDRIYVNDHNHVQFFKKYARDRGWYSKYSQDAYTPNNIENGNNDLMSLKLECELSVLESPFPYMDTFKYFLDDSNTLRNYCMNNLRDNKLECTDGGSDYYNTQEYYCSYYDRYYTEDDDVVYVERDSTYALRADTVYVNGELYWREDSLLVIDFNGYYIREDESVEIDGKFYHETSNAIIWSDYHNGYILRSEAIKTPSGDYIKKEALDEWLEEFDRVNSDVKLDTNEL